MIIRAKIRFLVEQLIRRCPKSGRIGSLCRNTRLAKILFPALGIPAIGILPSNSPNA